jgi:hypothetical protein
MSDPSPCIAALSGPGWRSASVDWPGGPGGIPSEVSHGYHMVITWKSTWNSGIAFFFQAGFLVICCSILQQLQMDPLAQRRKKPGLCKLGDGRVVATEPRFRALGWSPFLGFRRSGWFFPKVKALLSNSRQVEGSTWWSPIEGVPLFSGKPSWFLRRASGLSAK